VYLLLFICHYLFHWFCVYRITVQRSLEDAEEIERERRRRARASTSTEASLDNQLVSKT